MSFSDTTGGDRRLRLPERFILHGELGRGGMSRVFHATDTTLLKEVAIKVLHSSAQREPQQLMRFQREAKITGALKHRNILEIFDFGMTDDGEPYIVMDYVVGEPLSDILERSGPISEHHALPVMFEILDAVEYAHQHGVLHRDLKPSNILVRQRNDENDVIKLIDFGIARFADPDQSLTGSSGLYGSPAYMSPEQTHGANIDARSDIYSIGCVFFRILAGQPPFEAETLFEVLRMHCETPPPSLKDVQPQLTFSAEMEALISKCLEKTPENRFQSVTELKEALLQIEERDKATHQPADDAGTTDSAFRLAEHVQSNSRRALPRYTAALLVALITGISFAFAYFTLAEQKEKEESKAVKVFKDETFEDRLIAVRGNEPSFMLDKENNSSTVMYAQFPIVDEDLKELVGRSDFSKLKLRDKEVTGEGLKYVQNRHLKHLNMTKTDLNDAGYREISKLTSLETLDVNGCQFTNENVRMLEPLERLISLNITPGKGLDRRGFADMRNLKKLALLNVDGKLPAGAAEELAANPNFRCVDFYDCTVDPGDIAPFRKKVGKRISLNFTNVNVSDELLKTISTLKMERLGMGDVALTEKSFMLLSGMDVRLIALSKVPEINRSARERLRRTMKPRKLVFWVVEEGEAKPHEE